MQVLCSVPLDNSDEAKSRTPENFEDQELQTAGNANKIDKGHIPKYNLPLIKDRYQYFNADFRVT